VVSLIEAVGATVIAEQDQLSITAPSWRPTCATPTTMSKRSGRLIGFDQIPPVVPRAPVGRGLTRSQRARRAVTLALATSGFVEVLSFPFTSVDELDRMGIAPDDERRRLNKIINPLSETTPYLRTSLLPGLFGAALRNRSRGNDDLALFEAGSVFLASDPPAVAPRPPVTPASVGAGASGLGSGPRPATEAPGGRAHGQLAAGQLVGFEHPGGLAAGDRVRADRRRRGGPGIEPAGRGADAVAPRPMCRVRHPGG
jgi:phenylalanyl-tRNA synthetase beta chain